MLARMRFSLLFSSTIVVTSRAFYGLPQDVASAAPAVSAPDASANLERGFKNVVSELNAMHGFMVSTEQAESRQAQETNALKTQNAQYHDESQRLQQQLLKLQQELQQARGENSNLRAKDSQLTENYQKLSTASKKLAQQYKALNAQDGQLKAQNQQEANQIKSLKQEQSGLLGTLRKFKGIIAAQAAAQGQELDSAISGAASTPTAASTPNLPEPVPSVPEPVEAPMPALPEPAPLPSATVEVAPVQAPVAPAPQSAASLPDAPLPSLPEAPPAVSPTSEQIPDLSDMGPLELGPPPAPPKDSKAVNQKGKKNIVQQSSLEKDLSSLTDVRKSDDVPVPGMDPDVSKIAQADDQVLQMARDAGFLPSV